MTLPLSDSFSDLKKLFESTDDKDATSYVWGFDLTDFRSVKNFILFLNEIECDKVDPELVQVNNGSYNVWKFTGLSGDAELLTSCNPLTGEFADKNRGANSSGYASYMRLTVNDATLEDSQATAKTIRDLIHQYASVKGESEGHAEFI